ncbi:MAG: alpha/beta hydrolase, partial [Gammaproteobacteria bacterium]
PATYGDGTQTYPVLYVLDSLMYFGIASDLARIYGMGNFATRSKPPGLKLPSEMIVVGIGYPGEQPVEMTRDLLKRRMFDYTSLENPTGEGERLRSVTLADYPNGIPYGGAGEFFGLLRDVVVPLVEGSYRTSAERVLYGSSSGGHFAAYALLREDSPFSQYIIGSPAIYLCGEDLMEREAAYAARNTDLAAKVFLSFGNREWDEYAFPAVAGGTTRFGEKLVLRGYPSLRLRTQIIDRASHIEGCVGSLLFGLSTLTEWGL